MATDRRPSPNVAQRRWLKPQAVADRLSVHKSTLWRWVQDGTLPPPTKLAPRCVRWREDVIEEWERERAA